MKKFTAYFCALVCAASMLVPAANINAVEVSKTEVVSTQSVVSGGEIEVLAISQEDNATPQIYQGKIDPDSTVTYTFHLSKAIYFMGQAASEISAGDVYYEVYSASNPSDTLCNAYTSTSALIDNFTQKYLPAGDYVLSVRSSVSASGAFAFQVYGYDASTNATIKESTSYVGYNNKTVWKKIKVTNNGCLAIGATSFIVDSSGNAASSSGNKITLYNSKKKAISNALYTSSSQDFIECYGVKKGTYYIKISTPGCYRLYAKVIKKASLPAAKKTKAKKVTSSEKYYVIPASTSKSTSWFKFTVSKAKKLTLSTSYVGDYSVKVTIYRGTKQVDTFTMYNNQGRNIKYRDLLTQKEVSWPKGVYYVKITKGTKKDNGVVSLKVK